MGYGYRDPVKISLKIILEVQIGSKAKRTNRLLKNYVASLKDIKDHLLDVKLDIGSNGRNGQ
jgi:hypothetical protein